MAAKTPCKKCSALCCRNIALPLDKPKSRGDYDDIRWFLTHYNVSVFVEKGDWYINFKTLCRHLNRKTFRCEIYANRPNICRRYKTSKCELTSDTYDYDLHFTNDRQMQEYIKVRFDNMKTPIKRRNRGKNKK